MNQWNVDREFVLELDKDIIFENDDSKMRQLISECDTKGYFTSKKPIIWSNIKKIGILSKENTQGYNDFMTQFMLPIEICYKEIALEGPNTANSVIQAIEELQEMVDVMIIIRGGGSTSDISNSFDRMDIFNSIKSSSIPIITAIGHEADKGDKLLITSVSDYDFPTPSRAATELNKIFTEPYLYKINSYLQAITNKFQKTIQEQKDTEYLKLNCYIEQIIKNKFGGKIMTIDNTDTIIILQRDGKYYQQEIQYTQEMHIRHEDILLKTNIELAIYRKDINKLQEYVCEFVAHDNNMLPLMHDVFSKFKSIEKNLQKFDNNIGKKSKSMYCKEVDLQNITDMKLLIRLHDMYLWYKNVIEALQHRQHINEVMIFMAS
jgi:exodeoxyribonuclease VII large subunit